MQENMGSKLVVILQNFLQSLTTIMETENRLNTLTYGDSLVPIGDPTLVYF